MYKKIVLYILMAISVLSLDVYSKSGSWGVTGELQELYYAAAFHDEYANFINPAVITDVDQTEIVMYMSPKVLGASNLFYGSVFVPVGINHTIGLGYIGNGIWNIPLINNAGTSYGSANFLHHTVYGSYAWRVLPYLSAGINVKAFNKDLNAGLNDTKTTDLVSGQSGWTAGGDLGIIFNPFNIMNRGYSKYYRGNLNIGLTAKNALSWMKMGQEDVAKSVLFGMSYGWRHLFDASFYVNVSDLYPLQIPANKKDAKAIISSNVNADLRVQVHPLIGVKTGWSNDGIKCGVDFSYKRLSFFRYLELNYDLVYKPGDYIFVNNIKLITKVGPTREEMYSRSLFDVLKLAPNDLYKRALAKYKEKMYWESTWLFSELMTKYPRYYLVDAAAYYLADDFEKLSLDDLSRETYSKALATYTSSDYLDRYLLGVQNLDYKKGDYNNSMKSHKTLEAKYPKSTVLGESYYIAGQVKFREQKLDESLDLLSRVKNVSEAYLYALYTKAVIYAIQDKYDESLKVLTELRTKTPTNNAQKLIINRSHVLVGDILFERMKIKEALLEYMKVEKTVPFYDEVQLAIAWGFLKAQKTDAAIGYANNLINQYPNSIHVPEAVLIKGFASHMAKDFSDAVTYYDEAIKLTEAKKIDETEIKEKKIKNDKLVSKVRTFEDDLKYTALTRGITRKEEKKADLKTKYKDLNSNKIDYEAFINKISTIKKFVSSKNREKIINDAEYAKANALTQIQQQKKQEIINAAAKKAKEDKLEEEKLQKEIDAMDKE